MHFGKCLAEWLEGQVRRFCSSEVRDSNNLVDGGGSGDSKEEIYLRVL